MYLARVIGNLWATRKYASLDGQRLLLVQPLTFAGQETGAPIIALDTVDAGEGDLVIYSVASEAAIPFRPGLTPTDATIVGVVERLDRLGQTWRWEDEERADR